MFGLFRRKEGVEGFPIDIIARHCPSEAMRLCETFAVCVASERKSRTIEIRDVLAGVYLAAVGRSELAAFWPELDGFKKALLPICGELASPGCYHVPLQMKSASRELGDLIRRAMDLAESRNLRRMGRPVLCPKDMLYAVWTGSDRTLAAVLSESALDVSKLERAVATDEGWDTPV